MTSTGMTEWTVDIMHTVFNDPDSATIEIFAESCGIRLVKKIYVFISSNFSI